MGGAERYLLQLLPELKKRNIEVGFFCTLQDDNQEIIDYFTNHFDQYSIPLVVCKSSSPVSLKTAKQLAKTIRDGQYSILHAHLMHAEIISALSKMLFKIPVPLVVTKHGYLQSFMDVYGLDYTKINKWSLSYQVEKFVQHFVTKNVAVSEGLADFYVLSGICKRQKIEVIYHGQSDNFCDGNCSPVRLSNNQLLIAGRLKKFKGHILLLSALKYLINDIPDLKLIILGDGEEKKNLVKFVNNNVLNSWVVFAGYSNEVCSYFKGTDIVVAPSLAEPFGLIVLEAYSCSKPIVTFDVTAFNENVINNETGYLITPYNIEELAQKIKHLLQHKNIAKQLGENGHELMKTKFSLTTSVEKTIEFYQNISD